MIAYSIKKAIKSNIFQTICVSTEDEEIAQISQEYGAEVPFIRPEVLSRDPATIIDVMLHALDFYHENGEYFNDMTVLLPTAPFVSVSDIHDAHKIFKHSSADALMSVTKTEFPPYNEWLIANSDSEDYLMPCFPNSPYKHTKSTECPITYRSNGAILIVEMGNFKKHRGYQGSKIVPFIMPPNRSLDIDTRHEYMFAKYLMESGIYEYKQEIFE
jgi:N-acylneuraminate cytidylyltransferase/CMP-N,N'-diacetyllegionaminic acid synthase